MRVLSGDGVAFVAIPDKRFTFDHARPITQYEHLEADYQKGPEQSRVVHFAEWAQYVDGLVDGQEREKRIKQLMDQDYSIHFHVWSQFEMMEMFANLGKKYHFDLELMLKNENEVIFVLRKQAEKEKLAL